jgi:hypothetical protein
MRIPSVDAVTIVRPSRERRHMFAALAIGMRPNPTKSTATKIHSPGEGGRDPEKNPSQASMDIATTAGKTRDQLVQALVADATAKIEAAKSAGTITAAQATQLESGLTDRMTKLADATEPAGRGPRR